MEMIKWFKDIHKQDVGLVGGKGANLGEMFNIGLPVPGGFMVTASTYKQFIEETGIKKKIFEILKTIDVESTEDLQKKAKEIQYLINKTEVPEDIQKAITDAYAEISIESDKDVTVQELLDEEEPFVAVRSSATAEDLPEASFAGQQATFLNVKGGEDLVKATRACWASLFTARAIYYREKNNFEHEKVLIAVVVQKMVNADIAGVMFSVNPATNNKDEITIEAVYGLGETIVSGAVNPDYYLLDKESLEIKKIEVKEQEWGLFRNEKGENEKRNIEESKKKAQILDEAEIVALAKLGKKIEKHYGIAQDIEWAIEKGHIYIVQSRAVTTLKERKEEEVEVKGNVLLEGMTASPGIGVGTVKIVNDITELDKIKQGDVLVTVMTNPDMVQAMKRAAAIVTDEGGMTCFSGCTKILTTSGFMSMEQAYRELQNKQLEVLSFNPDTMKTEWKFALNPQKKKSVLWKVAISQTGGSKQNLLKITPDHKMVTLENRKIVERKLNELLVNGEKVCVADYLPVNQNPHCLDEPEKAYLCGALFADGYINSSEKKGYVTFIQKNISEKKVFIDTVKDYFLKVFGTGMIYTRIRSGGGKIRKKMMSGSASDFISFKKKPAGELFKIRENIVDWVLHLNDISLKKFLAGVIDGDGTFNVSHESGRIHIYASKEYLVQGIVLACLRLGILPQISKQRGSCYSIQIVDKTQELLSFTKRVKGETKKKILGTKLLATKQVLGDVIDDVNYKGRIKPYVKKNLLLDVRKIKDNLLPLFKEGKIKKEIEKIINSDFRMQRLNKVEELEEDDVYNFEVEGNHTYVVFTENYTPLIVWNCHAAIVSREMGIPCVVGTKNATKVLKEGDTITVYATKGRVYEGAVAESKSGIEYEKIADIKTKTKILTIMGMPDYAEQAAKTGAEGVGLLRIEFIIANHGVHPAEYMRENRDEDYADALVEGIKIIAEAFKGKSVWVRTSDLRSDEYRNLKGGDKEPTETDPMIGWHGIRRGIDEPRILKGEFLAIKKLHDMGYTNCGIMIPFVIIADEVKKAKEICREVGLEPCKDVEFGIMVETPAACWEIEEICKEGIDFASFGTNDLTQLTLGLDRNNERIQKLFDEMHPAVLGEMAKVMDTCHKYGVKISICGQAGSRPEMAEFLVKHHVGSISANPDAVAKIKKVVAETEKKLGIKVK